MVHGNHDANSKKRGSRADHRHAHAFIAIAAGIDRGETRRNAAVNSMGDPEAARGGENLSPRISSLN
jgi:hypothetical protein